MALKSLHAAEVPTGFEFVLAMHPGQALADTWVV